MTSVDTNVKKKQIRWNQSVMEVEIVTSQGLLSLVISSMFNFCYYPTYM